MKPRLHRSTLNVNARSDEGVERSGDSRAPTAFRIWRAGENKADDGSIFFTEESAAKLMAEQDSRGRVMAIDFDHLSLSEDRPAEAGRAAGWHRIEARETDDGPELWAVDVSWCADAKAGLEEDPPRWRFFSPAFYTDADQQVSSYINLALCINPMTHGIPLLASRKLTTENSMPTAEEALAALDAMIDAETDESKKAALVAAREALATKKGVDETTSDDEPGVEADAAKVEATTHAADDEEGKKDKPKESAAKQHAAKTDPVASLTAQLLVNSREIEVMKIDALLAKHSGLPEEFRAHCRKQSLESAKVMISTVSAATKTHATRNTMPAQGPVDNTPPLDARIAEDLDRGMGVRSDAEQLPKKDAYGRLVMHTVKPSALARLNAQKGKVA